MDTRILWILGGLGWALCGFFTFFWRRTAAKSTSCWKGINEAAEEIARLKVLLQSLKGTESVDPASFSLSRKAVSMQEMVEGLLEVIHPVASQRNVEFLLRVSQDLEPVYVDEARIRNFLQILLAHTIGKAPAGSRVSLSARQLLSGVSCLELTLQDEGASLPQEMRLLFRMICAHGGQWDETAHPGKGKTLRFTLPLFEPLSATRDRFLALVQLSDRIGDRVGVILIRPGLGLPEEGEFLKRLATLLRQSIRRTDWLTALSDERLLVFVGALPQMETESLLRRIREVLCREEVAWRAGRGVLSCTPRPSLAIAVYPTEAETFDSLMALAKRRLENEQSVNFLWNNPQVP